MLSKEHSLNHLEENQPFPFIFGRDDCDVSQEDCESFRM